MIVAAKFLTRIYSQPGGDDDSLVGWTEPGTEYTVNKRTDDGWLHIAYGDWSAGWCREEQYGVQFFKEVQDGIQD